MLIYRTEKTEYYYLQLILSESQVRYIYMCILNIRYVHILPNTLKHQFQKHKLHNAK